MTYAELTAKLDLPPDAPIEAVAAQLITSGQVMVWCQVSMAEPDRCRLPRKCDIALRCEPCDVQTLAGILRACAQAPAGTDADAAD